MIKKGTKKPTNKKVAKTSTKSTKKTTQKRPAQKKDNKLYLCTSNGVVLGEVKVK